MSGKKSRMLFEAACKIIPGGVNSPVRAAANVESFPLFIASALGSHINTVDGKSLIDFVQSWGAMILGHAHPEISAAVTSAACLGTSYGAPCQAELILARLITEAFPAMEMVRMVNSGTEATMSALRLARGITGRNKLIKFMGCYHGHADPFLASAGSGLATLSIPGTPGVPEATVEDTLLAPYNDIEAVRDLFGLYGQEIAAVIVEPVAANMGLILPVADFLKGLREECDTHGSILIFDEVITGFRIGYSGAQAHYNIVPDLTTCGKIVGGGLPAAAFGGKAKYMKHIAPCGEIYQAGTLSGNPLAMSAGIAALNLLKKADYAGLEKRVGEFVLELKNILQNKGLLVEIPHIASMFSIFFTSSPVHNFDEAKKADTKAYTHFYKQMRRRGINFAPSPFETAMVSFAHTDEDMQKTLNAAEKIRF